MIEGVSVGVGSTGTGYNSENYEYKLFEIKATDPNIGGTLGTVRYSLSDVIPEGSVPGTFISATSAGKIIPESYFPIFDVELVENRFEIGETLISENKKGILQSTNKLSGILKISSPHTFTKGKSIIGESSKTRGTIIESTGYTSFYNVESSYDKLPSTFDMAVSYKVAGATLAATYTSHNFRYDDLALGAEYELMNMVYLRLTMKFSHILD